MFEGITNQGTPVRRAFGQAPPERLLVAMLTFVAGLPSLIVAALRPELLMDDLQLAAAARFEGLGGFSEMLSFRPGMGVVFGIQYGLLGDHAAFHLVAIAAGNAAVAFFLWRMLRSALTVEMALPIALVFILLPNRSSVRFWGSTLPNHAAMCLLLAAATIAIAAGRRAIADKEQSRPHHHSIRTWASIIGLLMASVLTYEGGICLAGLTIAGLAIVSPTRRDRFVMPVLGFGFLGAAALFVVIQAPRSGATTFLARPADALPIHLTALGPAPFSLLFGLTWVVAVAVSVWALITRRAAIRVEYSLVLVGAVVALAGLAPFAAAGFNIQGGGVLDRAHYFANLGTAVVLGAVVIAVRRMVSARSALLGSAVAAALMAVGIAADIPGYVQSSRDQREAAAALAGVDPALMETGFVLNQPPINGGVTWGFYTVQLRDLYQLTLDEPEEPEWLFLSRDSDPPPELSFFDVADGELIAVDDD